MSKNTTTTDNASTETETVKRGRKPLTFEDIVSREPNELDHAWSEYMLNTFNETVTPRAVRLMFMASVREMFYDSDLYKDAQAIRQARIDAAKAEVEEKAKIREANKKNRALMAEVASIDPDVLRAFLAAQKG